MVISSISQEVNADKKVVRNKVTYIEYVIEHIRDSKVQRISGLQSRTWFMNFTHKLKLLITRKVIVRLDLLQKTTYNKIS